MSILPFYDLQGPHAYELQARSDLQMEFFHLISFLLTHCTNKWKAANDQVTSKFIYYHPIVTSGSVMISLIQMLCPYFVSL